MSLCAIQVSGNTLKKWRKEMKNYQARRIKVDKVSFSRHTIGSVVSTVGSNSSPNHQVAVQLNREKYQQDKSYQQQITKTQLTIPCPKSYQTSCNYRLRRTFLLSLFSVAKILLYHENKSNITMKKLIEQVSFISIANSSSIAKSTSNIWP